jgi:hypothetical protein
MKTTMVRQYAQTLQAITCKTGETNSRIGASWISTIDKREPFQKQDQAIGSCP